MRQKEKYIRPIVTDSMELALESAILSASVVDSISSVKTAGQEDGSPRLIVKSRYAVIANLLGAGQFYRMVQFLNMNSVIAGFDVTANPWESNASLGASLEPGLSYELQSNALVNAPAGLSQESGNW